MEFSAEMIETLRKEYSKIQGIDPCQPTYKKLCAFLDDLADAHLSQIAGAAIKFVSPMAKNRCFRRGIA